MTWRRAETDFPTETINRINLTASGGIRLGRHRFEALPTRFASIKMLLMSSTSPGSRSDSRSQRI